MFRCGGKSDLTSEDRERSNEEWPPDHIIIGSEVKMHIMLDPNSVEKHLKCHYQLTYVCPFIW